MDILTVTTENESATRRLAARLARHLRPNDCLVLRGDFGSGKTTFVRGLACGLKVRRPREVASPSFVILKIYSGRLKLYHFDLYRLRHARDLDAVGLDEFLDAGGVAAVEWPDTARGFLPARKLDIRFSMRTPRSRRIHFSGPSTRWHAPLARLKAEFKKGRP